jgi:ankyrin repeat protein
VTARSLPPRPNLDHLKRQAKELLRRQPGLGRLRDAQRAVAEQYGFVSWDALRTHVAATTDAVTVAMLKPDELESQDGHVLWDTFTASAAGDVAALRTLLDRNPRLSRAEYWYTPVVHFAVREGRAEAVQVLLDAGADPEWNGLHEGSLIDMAKDRGHTRIARLLEQARDRRGRVVAQPVDHPVHTAAARGHLEQVRALLDADASLVHLGDSEGGTPLHRAILRGARDTVTLLLDRGADVHAFHGSARGLSGGFWTDLQAIDLAIWGGRRRDGDIGIARLLLSRGATCDLTVAAALGDIERVRQILDGEPARIGEARPSGRRPLSAAVEFGHEDVARLLLERGADPTWAEPAAPKGVSLHSAASAGNLRMVELLLAHGADPNAQVDSSADPISLTTVPEIRAVIAAHGGTLPTKDDDDLVRRVLDDASPSSRGMAFAMICGDGKRDLLDRLLRSGVRVPPVVTSCQGYFLKHSDMLRTLLAHDMNPDLMNWQHQTLLHLVCRRPDTTGAAVEQATILLEAGANISARDDEYRSTPLAWAARTNSVQMVEVLLARGAPTNLPDDEPWATPLAWAERRQHTEVVSILRRQGAER